MLLQCEDITRIHCLGTRKKACTTPRVCWHLDLGLPNLWKVESTFLCVIILPAYGTLLQHLKHTTVEAMLSSFLVCLPKSLRSFLSPAPFTSLRCTGMGGRCHGSPPSGLHILSSEMLLFCPDLVPVRGSGPDGLLFSHTSILWDKDEG